MVDKINSLGSSSLYRGKKNNSVDDLFYSLLKARFTSTISTSKPTTDSSTTQDNLSTLYGKVDNIRAQASPPSFTSFQNNVFNELNIDPDSETASALGPKLAVLYVDMTSGNGNIMESSENFLRTVSGNTSINPSDAGRALTNASKPVNDWKARGNTFLS